MRLLFCLVIIFSAPSFCHTAKTAWYILPRDLRELARNEPPETATLFRSLASAADESARDAGAPFEKIAHEKIAAFFGKTPTLEQLAAAETALQAALRFHHATSLAANEDVRPDVVRLEDLLLDVNLQRLEQLTAGTDLPLALRYGDQLRRVYPQSRKLLPPLRKLWSRAAQAALERNDYAGARQMLDRIDADFADEGEPQLRATLQERAAVLMKEAAPLDAAAAVVKLREAYALFPGLPGLGDALAKHEQGERVLYVGVPALPDSLTPDAASTDVERAVVELMFESLVRSISSQNLGQRYLPELAAALPTSTAGQRHVELRHDAYWSNGERVTAADVRHTVHSFLPPVWHDLFDRPQLEQAPFLIRLQLRQGLFDPLGLLSFKVMPENYRGKPLQRDDAEYARNPIGSGPFVYVGRQTEGGRQYAVFRANPNYARSSGVLPIIRELRLFAWPDNSPGRKPPAELLIDVPAEQVAPVLRSGVYQVQSLLPNRIHFLAINHRVPALADTSLRRALAHIIDREAILARVYRRPYPGIPFLGTGNAALVLAYKAEEAKLSSWHRVLNGPYPPDSWACCPPPRVLERLYDAELARALLQKAVGQLKGQVFTLKYPLYDSRTGAACEMIAAQVNQLADDAGVKFRLQGEGLAPAALSKAINDHDFELAYMEHDFQDETFSLGAWFDARAEALAAGGSNFLGYENDAALLALLRAASSHRQFTALQDTTHAVHARLHERMPFIPLWQLHRTAAVHRDLQARLDALHVFGNVELWRFAK